jgi:hypothetical protein
MTLIDPRGMADVREWADFVTLPLLIFGADPRRLDNPMNWKEWAYNLTQSTTLQKYNPPDPRFFSEWQEWASRFNQVVPY